MTEQKPVDLYVGCEVWFDSNPTSRFSEENDHGVVDAIFPATFGVRWSSEYRTAYFLDWFGREIKPISAMPHDDWFEEFKIKL